MHVERDDRAVDAAFAHRVAPPALRELVARVLAPAPRRRAQIDDHLARTDQLVLLVDFLQLVRGARAIPFPLRHFDVRVVDVVVQPGLVKAVLCHAMKRLLPIAS